MKTPKKPDTKAGDLNRTPEFTFVPSHSPFWDLINFSVRGRASPVFKTPFEDDHVSELCLLYLDDIESNLLGQKSDSKPGPAIGEAIDMLARKAAIDNDPESAKILFSVATQAAFEVMSLYLRHRDLFDQIASGRKLLPQLTSIHPGTAPVMRKMIEDARLGTQTDDGARILSKPWFTSDKPANVYARAIIASVQMNWNLKPVEQQQTSWAPFDEKHGCKTCVLPFPSYLADIAELPVPFGPDVVKEYWEVGKKIILEDIPEFIEFPEWESYHERHYKGGAKPGVIRSAIFRDILESLRQIAGPDTGD